jgi:hypothetical protein
MICDLGENAASSSQRWLDELAERASLAGFVDREGAAIVLGKLFGRPISTETVRRWPIPYVVVAGCSRYEIKDLIEYARRQYDQAPRRIGGRCSQLVVPGLSVGRPEGVTS